MFFNGRKKAQRNINLCLLRLFVADFMKGSTDYTDFAEDNSKVKEGILA